MMLPHNCFKHIHDTHISIIELEDAQVSKFLPQKQDVYPFGSFMKTLNIVVIQQFPRPTGMTTKPMMNTCCRLGGTCLHESMKDQLKSLSTVRASPVIFPLIGSMLVPLGIRIRIRCSKNSVAVPTDVYPQFQGKEGSIFAISSGSKSTQKNELTG
ncbi:hypothetical protein QQ045_009762 [Rhodiola kirilowii]